jgi:hypothetical protein
MDLRAIFSFLDVVSLTLLQLTKLLPYYSNLRKHHDSWQGIMSWKRHILVGLSDRTRRINKSIKVLDSRVLKKHDISKAHIHSQSALLLFLSHAACTEALKCNNTKTGLEKPRSIQISIQPIIATPRNAPANQ